MPPTHGDHSLLLLVMGLQLLGQSRHPSVAPLLARWLLLLMRAAGVQLLTHSCPRALALLLLLLMLMLLGGGPL